jgi:DNA-binding LytR/AlgR family response regulator
MRWKASIRGWATDLAISAAGGLFFGLIGPFGSYLNGPAWQRVAFQVACFVTGMVVYGAGARLIMRGRTPGLRTFAAIVVMVAVVTWPFSQFVAWLGRAIWPFLAFQSGLEWYLQGLVTAEPIVLAMTFLIASRYARRPGPAPASAHGGLLGAAPGEVLCLQMEDHYVRVHTAAGSRLVFATLSQAIAAVGGREGLQVHRSWWVASQAVAGAEAHGRNLRLRLVNGVTAPVARSAVAAVRAAGWIGDARAESALERA